MKPELSVNYKSTAGMDATRLSLSSLIKFLSVDRAVPSVNGCANEQQSDSTARNLALPSYGTNHRRWRVTYKLAT